MKTFYAPAHLDHAPAAEFEMGRLRQAVEIPERAEAVRARIAERGLGPIVPPRRFDDAELSRVHDPAFLEFLRGAHAAWVAHHGDRAGPEAIPSCWPARGLRERRRGDIETLLGTYAFDTATPIAKGTWSAARAAADVALSAAEAVASGERAAFALTRPPGHHASRDVFGGYCYLNNVAIAAEWLAARGFRNAILDVDYHHGNGTQSLFYARGDVFFASLHADPSFAFPHYLGFADERGEGGGEGANLNIPLPAGTRWDSYSDAMATAAEAIREFSADILLVSLGLDTFERDPICQFRLQTEDYLRMGETIAALGKPTVFVFEGGYSVEALGENAANVLQGYSDG